MLMVQLVIWVVCMSLCLSVNWCIVTKCRSGSSWFLVWGATTEDNQFALEEVRICPETKKISSRSSLLTDGVFDFNFFCLVNLHV